MVSGAGFLLQRLSVGVFEVDAAPCLDPSLPGSGLTIRHAVAML